LVGAWGCEVSRRRRSQGGSVPSGAKSRSTASKVRSLCVRALPSRKVALNGCCARIMQASGPRQPGADPADSQPVVAKASAVSDCKVGACLSRQCPPRLPADVWALRQDREVAGVGVNFPASDERARAYTHTQHTAHSNSSVPCALSLPPLPFPPFPHTAHANSSVPCEM